MKLTNKHVSDDTLTGLILEYEMIIRPDENISQRGISNILSALLELKQRRAEDRAKDAALETASRMIARKII
jgi:hypothetical protein